jgi:dihydrofolate reductase
VNLLLTDRAATDESCFAARSDSSRGKEEQMEGKVVWHVTMSLDGFIAGPDDAMEWAFERDETPSRVADEVMATGAILAGRRWYDVATSRYAGREGIYGGAWTGPVFVLTHRLPDAPHDPGITFLSDGIEGAVATARAAAEGKNLEVFGATTAQQCLDADLLDEIVVHLAPLLLGDGVRFYGGPGVGRVDLERTTVAESGQLTDLRFRVVK